MTKHLTLLLFIGLSFWGCDKSSKEVLINDVSVTILPYVEKERGRFWEICIDGDYSKLKKYGFEELDILRNE